MWFCPKHHRKGLREVRKACPEASYYPQPAAVSPWPVIVPVTGDEALEKWPQRGHRGFYSWRGKPSPWPCSLGCSTITPAVGVCSETHTAECQKHFFPVWTVSIYLPSITMCLSSLTWALTSFLLPLPWSSWEFCNSCQGAPTAQDSWKTQDK